MVLPIVVNTDRKIAIDKSKYDHGLDDGLFLTEDGSLGMKRKSGEFKDQLSDVKSSIKNAYDIAEELFSSKKTLNKADKQKILDVLAKANRDIGCNAEYALDCFNEQMEKSVTEARGEIEAFMQNQIQNIAMKAIATNVDENGLPDFNKMIAIE